VCGGDLELATEVMALLDHEARSRSEETARPYSLAAEAFEAAQVGSLIGQTVGRFRLEAEIASGGMGRVFKARRIDGDVEQIVALKLIRRELFNDVLLKRFSDERRILATLNHSGIAHLIDAGTDTHGAPFVAMEYVEGLPLIDYCARHALQVRERVQLFRQVLAAVSYAHRNLVVHRDLKPDNILVTAEGQAKLLDFGIAKTLEKDPQRTTTAARFLTPAYAAPEQLRGEPTAIACDVYALGAILYAMLAGVPPFDAATADPGQFERQILKVPPEALPIAAAKRGAERLREQTIANAARWAKQLAGDLDAIVQKALRKEPEARYVSVEHFDEDLNRYLEQRPVRASSAGWWYRTRKFCGRNTATVAFSAIAIAASVATMIYILHQNVEIRDERDRAQAALGILKKSFEVASPEQRSGDNYSQVLAILAAAASEVGGLEKTKPALFQEISYQIAEIQVGIGSVEDGLALVRRANRIGPDVPKQGALLEIYALTITGEQKQLKEARAMLEAVRKKMADDPQFLVREAILLSYEKRYPEAIRLSQRLSSQKAVMDSDWARGQMLYALARSYRGSGDLKKAEDTMAKVVADRSRLYGEGHTRTLVTRIQRVQLLIDMKDQVSAQKELTAMKPLVDRSRDYASGLPAAYHHLFAMILDEQKRTDDALSHMRQALAAAEIGDGVEGWEASMIHFNTAKMIANAGQDRRKAYFHCDRAIAGVEKTKGQSSPVAGSIRRTTAEWRIEDGDLQGARTLLAPANALRYFERLNELGDKSQARYLNVLYQAFGAQDCRVGWEKRMQVHPLTSQRIARTLICRHDPEGKFRQAQ
jgi:eukaryotic-like serine/threonine-protein kinase